MKTQNSKLEYGAKGFHKLYKVLLVFIYLFSFYFHFSSSSIDLKIILFQFL